MTSFPWPSDRSPSIRAVLSLNEDRVSLSEVLSSLSHALDLTEGMPLGHSMRSCIIGMRIARELRLSPDDQSALYYALLLKDAGCSSNAARMAALFGTDDRVVKPHLKVADWHKGVGLAVRTLQVVGRGQGFRERLRHTRAIIAHRDSLTREFIAVRCDRGANIARRLGFPELTASAIRSLDEHWCGLGYPEGLATDSIPLLARIINIAQTVEAFHSAQSLDAALRVVRRRRGTWFDPRLADIVLSWRHEDDWWRRLRSADPGAVVLAMEPEDRIVTADETGLDEIARAFADIIDAKSPYTSRHSVRVAELARAIARHAGVSAAEARRVYRAGLLHDIGKLGVSSAVLDKDGPLTPAERAEVERHPMYSLSILLRVSSFGHFAWTAAVHHERLDGTGYPWRLTGAQLDQSARLLAVADVFEALTATRPYRNAMPYADAMAILEQERGGRLCSDAIDALPATHGVLEALTASN